MSCRPIYRPCIHILLIIVSLFAVTFAEAQTNHQSGKKNLTAVIPIDSPPTYYKDSRTDEPAGFAVDVMNAVGKEAGYSIRYEFKKGWTEIIEAVKTGAADIAPDLGITEERKKVLSFTLSTDTFPVSVFVRAGSNLTGLRSGINVGVLRGSAAYEIIKDRYSGITAKIYDSFEDGLLDLLAGQIDAFCCPAPTLIQFAGNADLEDRIKIVGLPLMELKRAIAVRRDNRELLAGLNKAVDDFVGTPAYQQIYSKWYGKRIPYWTTTRIVIFSGTLLFMTVCGMALWRYMSIVKINKELKKNIADREQAENRLFVANCALNAINRCNKAITHAQEETDLLNEVCKIIVETGGYRMCWIGYAEHCEAKRVRPAAQTGYEDNYLNKIRVTWDDTEYGRGPVGTAIRTGKASIFNSITTNPDFSPWREDALKRGYASVIGLPLNDNSETFGALAIYAAEPNAFDKDEVVLLTSLSDNLAYGIMTLRTLAEQKKAEKSLIQSEEKYRSLFEESKDVVFISTPDGRYLDINQAGIELLGYSSKEELLNIDIARDLYVNPEDRKRYELMLHENGFVKDYQLEMKRKDGHKLTVLSTSSIERDEEGSVLAYRGIMRDITEHKKLEQQLLQAQKMEAVGRLAGGIAHDFNNLMTAIIGYSDLVLGELPEKHFARDKIRIVRDTGDKAADLVRQLLAFSRNQMLEMKPVNLNEIVWNMNKIFGRTIGEDIELELNINKPVKNVLADAGQIEQVLMNLIVNARDAMPGGGRLIIETDDIYLDETYSLMHSQLVKPGHYVMLSVTDNGIGISHEIREQIFEPFFTTKGTGRGTGLGLSTTYGIIKQHDGYIWAYSEPGKGATFKVYLPAIEEEAKKIKKDEQPTTFEGTETILVVDDEPLIRQFVIEVLQRHGYRLFEADSGEEALKIAEQVGAKIDLLLTDLVMPGMKGSELRELFIEKWPKTKVIIMSGYGDKEIFDEGMKDAGFIQKPLTPIKLTTKLREVLD